METEWHSTTDKNSLLKNNRMALLAAFRQVFNIFVTFEKMPTDNIAKPDVILTFLEK